MIVFAIWLPVFLGMAALAIDSAQLYTARSLLQTSADSAALAGAVFLPDEDAARAGAIAAASANLPDGHYGDVLVDAGIVAGFWNEGTRTFSAGASPRNAVRVTTRMSATGGNPIDLPLSDTIGMNITDVSAEAVAMAVPDKIELALVLDNSGSMDMFGGSMQWLIDAANQLLDTMFGGLETLQDSRVAIVPFRALVKVGTEHANWANPAPPAGWNGCLEQRFEPVAGDPWRLTDTPPNELPFKKSGSSGYQRMGNGSTNNNNCSVKMIGLTADRTTVDNTMAGLGAQYQTDMHEAMAWGWRALSPRWRGLWGEADFPHDYADEWRKVVVMVTDGHSSPWMSPYNDSQHDQKVPDVCQDMKDQGIEIYVVWLDKNNNAKDAARPYYEDCASDGNHFLNLETEMDIQPTFDEIAKRLVQPHLVN